MVFYKLDKRGCTSPSSNRHRKKCARELGFPGLSLCARDKLSSLPRLQECAQTDAATAAPRLLSVRYGISRGTLPTLLYGFAAVVFTKLSSTWFEWFTFFFYFQYLVLTNLIKLVIDCVLIRWNNGFKFRKVLRCFQTINKKSAQRYSSDSILCSQSSRNILKVCMIS